MKKIYTKILSIIICISFLGSTISVHASSSSTALEQSKKYDFLSKISDHEYTNQDITNIVEDMRILENFKLNTNTIEKVEIKSNKTVYSLHYNNVLESMTIEKKSDGSLEIVVVQGNKQDTLLQKADGTLYIDNYEIEVINSKNAFIAEDNKLRGTVYKGIKSLSPYGSYSSSSYNKLLATNTQNIGLGKALNAFTITALALIIGKFYPYVSIAVDLSGVAAAVYSVLISINPTTQTLGCKYSTYTASAEDYKYINNFYANASCTGNYRQEISYEHFIVY